MSKTKLYETVKEKLETLEGIAFGGYFNNQFEREAGEDAHKWPITYFEFSLLDWFATTGTSRNTQKGDIEIIIYVGFKTIAKDNIAFIDEIDRVYTALEGLEGSDGLFDPLRRVREIPNSDVDNVFVWQIHFSTRLLDISATNYGSQVITATGISITRDLEIDNEIVRSGKI